MVEAAEQSQTPRRPRRRAAPASTPESVAGTPPANTNTVGQSLRLAREQRRESIEKIADLLKIRRIYLQALESADWENLPELVYAQGFVRTYAAYLDLDENACVQQFKREFRGGRRTPELDMPMPIDDNQLPSWKIIVGVLGALLLFYVLMGLLSPSQQPDPTPTVASTEQPTGNAPPSASEMPAPQMATDTPMTPIGNAVPASGETGSANVAATGIAYGAANATRVTIVAAQDSWVQVRAADGQVVFSRVMRPGDSFRVPDDSNLNLTTGNLSGLHFTIDGKGVTPNGPPGTVLRNLPLSADALGQNLSQISANTNSNVQPQ